MEFTRTINAPREKVWEALWNIDNYIQWTQPFQAGSTVETNNWKKGSKVLFLDGKGSGMVSTVSENIPNEFMGFTHVGMVNNGVEDLESEEVKQWAGSYENYTLKDKNGSTELFVELGGATMPADMEAYFQQAWPKALDELQQIAEKS